MFYMNSIIATVISIIFSGLAATVITILYQKFSAEKSAKRRVFETAVAYRFFISEEENVKALNSIEAIFYNNANVRRAWKAFLEESNKKTEKPEQLNDKYIKLLEEMAIACGYKKIKWDDLKPYYYPIGLSEQKRNEEILKRLQIKVAEQNAISQAGRQNTSQPEVFTNELILQLLHKLLENPEGFERLLDIAEKSNSKEAGK